MTEKFIYLIPIHRQNWFAIIGIDDLVRWGKGSRRVVGSIEGKGFIKRVIDSEKVWYGRAIAKRSLDF